MVTCRIKQDCFWAPEVLGVGNHLPDVGGVRLSINLVLGVQHCNRFVIVVPNYKVSYEFKALVERQMNLGLAA